MLDLSFYKNKRVLVTGHTGFKGAWLSRILVNAGAVVTGYALEAPTSPSLFEAADIAEGINSVIGDIRDFDKLKAVFDEFQPEIVFHLAAQPIVLTSYEQPKYTYETNVLGTVNVLECVRLCESVKSVLNVTTDKVYENNDTLMRPLVMDFADDAKVADIYDTYLFGDSILVHIVSDYGVQKSSVYLPCGAEWVDFYSNKRYGTKPKDGA